MIPRYIDAPPPPPQRKKMPGVGGVHVEVYDSITMSWLVESNMRHHTSYTIIHS